MKGPGGELALGNVVVEVPDREVRVVPGEVVSLGAVKVQDALVRLVVELNKKEVEKGCASIARGSR